MKCAGCKKSKGSRTHSRTSSGSVRYTGHAADVLTRSAIVAHPHERRDFWVTFDVLPIVRQVAPTIADSIQFRIASQIADDLRTWGARRA